MVAKTIRLFSERVVSEKCIPVELPTGLRERISMVLEEFNFAIEIPGSPSDSWILEVTDVLTRVTQGLEQLYGVEQLWAFDDNENPAPVELEEFVQRTEPAQIFDVLEVFYDCSEDPHKLEFQRALNDLLQEHQSDWRMKDGRFSGKAVHVPARPITAPTNELLEGESRLVAALDQFHEAQNDLQAGDYQAAIDHIWQAAHLSGSFILFATNLILQERPAGKRPFSKPSSKKVKGLQVVSEAS